MTDTADQSAAPLPTEGALPTDGAMPADAAALAPPPEDLFSRAMDFLDAGGPVVATMAGVDGTGAEGSGGAPAAAAASYLPRGAATADHSTRIRVVNTDPQNRARATVTFQTADGVFHLAFDAIDEPIDEGDEGRPEEISFPDPTRESFKLGLIPSEGLLLHKDAATGAVVGTNQIYVAAVYKGV